ncbi:MAG: alginate export family protein [Gammaproteobacteria bacterium]
MTRLGLLQKHRTPLSITVLIIMGFAAMGDRVHAEQSIVDALTSGKVDLYLRYRFEFVDDDNCVVSGCPPTNDQPLDAAYASTLRTALGYSTGLFYDFGAYVQLEDVRVVGNDTYNDGGSNGVVDKAVVVDPEGTEINQANLRYRGIPKTTLKLGRQEIEHRQAPLHRWIGNILWRQNWQSFDAFRVTSDYVPATVLDYSYVWNTNRIFGEDNPLPDRSDFRMDSYFLRAVYSGFPLGKVEPYAYLLDFESTTSAGLSTQTYGLRFEGAYDIITYPVKILYTAEYANQSDYGDNPADINVNYFLGEAGFTYSFVDLPIELVTVKGSFEVLEGDGCSNPAPVTGSCGGRLARALQTPLGTNHAFQGWADRFLTTPADGIEDAFVTLNLRVYGTNFLAVWHSLMANDADYDYGTEWNLLLERPIGNHFLAGVKYAYYDASGDALNRARNRISGQAFDLEKAWAYVQFKF